MTSSTDLLQRYFQLNMSSKLRRIISQIDHISRLATIELKSDFVALFYADVDSGSFIPVSFSTTADVPDEDIDLLINRWSAGKNSKTMSAELTPHPVDAGDAFAAKCGFRYALKYPCRENGAVSGMIVAYFAEEPNWADSRRADKMSVIADILMDAIATTREANLVDNYSRRVSKLINMFEIPLNENGFKEVAGEIVRRFAPVVPVRGISLYFRDTQRGGFRAQSIAIDDKLPATFHAGLTDIVAERYRQQTADDQKSDHWYDLSDCFTEMNLAVASIEFSVDKRFQYVLVAWTDVSDGLHRNDRELLRVFALFSRVVLRNALLIRNIRKAQRMIEKTSGRMADVETTAALADMTSGVAHEFNNIIGGVVGRLQLIKMKSDDDTFCDELDKIESLVMEGARTIKRIQEYTIGVRHKNLGRIDLCEVVRRAADGAASGWSKLATGRRIEIAVNLPPMPVEIEGHEKDLRIALDKILENAVESSDEGSTVEVSLTADGKDAVVRIADNGAGISRENRTKIFYPFFTSKPTRGAGLSLSIVHGVISRHGARIRVSDNKPKGTVFELIFDLPEAIDGDSDISSQAQRSDHLKILVVDDDQQIREVLRDMLSLYGHALVTCPDAYAALKSLEAQEFDILITDLGMPGMSGLDLARVAHENHPTMPIAMITGWGTQLNQDEVAANGIMAVLAKPFHLKEVRELVQQLVQGASPRQVFSK